MDASDIAVILVVIVLRLVVPLFIPIFPLPAVILALVIDGVDQTVFQTFTKAPLAGYQSYDNALDIYYLTIAFLSTFRNWENLQAFTASRFLFYYRLIGVVLFESTHLRALLLFFPNTFEYFFIFMEAVHTRWNPKRIAAAGVVLAMWAIWVFIKVPQEYWIHIAKLDTTDAIKSQVFGVSPESSWGAAVANNPMGLLGMALAVWLLVWTVRTVSAGSIPPPDRPGFSLRIRQSDLDVTEAEAQAAQRARAGDFLQQGFWEKVALVTLTGMIFTHILPGVGASTLQLFVGTLILIFVNTVVSEWLQRQGMSWSTTIRQFVVMLAINSLAVWAMTWALPGPWFKIPQDARWGVVFLVLLMTLIVTMYDRFRPFYLARLDRQARLDASVSAGLAQGGS
ncbi:MAG: hypothetical protein ACR2J8_15090 [Thermomicrobiales bacterium]